MEQNSGPGGQYGRRESGSPGAGGGNQLANYLVVPLNSKSTEERGLVEKSIKELFDSIDKDGDGFVGANELRNYLIGTNSHHASPRPQTQQGRSHEDDRRC